MPTISLHIPDADLELFKYAADQNGWTVKRFILEAAEKEAMKMKRQRKLIRPVQSK